MNYIKEAFNFISKGKLFIHDYITSSKHSIELSIKLFFGYFVSLDILFGPKTDRLQNVCILNTQSFCSETSLNKIGPLSENHSFMIDEKLYYCILEPDGYLSIIDESLNVIYKHLMFDINNLNSFMPKLGVCVDKITTKFSSYSNMLKHKKTDHYIEKTILRIVGGNITGDINQVVLGINKHLLEFYLISEEKDFLGYSVLQVAVDGKQSFFLDSTNTLHIYENGKKDIVPTLEFKDFSTFQQPKFIFYNNNIFFTTNNGKIVCVNRENMEILFVHTLVDPMDIVLNDPIRKKDYIIYYTHKGEILIFYKGKKVLSAVVNTNITGACIKSLPNDFYYDSAYVPQFIKSENQEDLIIKEQKGKLLFINADLDLFCLNFDTNYKFEIQQMGNLQKLSNNQIQRPNGTRIFGPFELSQNSYVFFSTDGKIINVTIEKQKIKNIRFLCSNYFKTDYDPVLFEKYNYKIKSDKKIFLLFSEKILKKLCFSQDNI